MIKKYVIKILSTLSTVIQYSCVTHCALEYVGDFVVCTGPSMEPTIFSNDILFTEHITPRLRTLKRGDIIIAKCPTNPQQHICKRIAAMEGDKVRYGFTTYIVPNGHVWLEGDNNTNSTDSRIYGPVPQGLLKSRVIFKVWPFNEISLLTTTNKYINQD